jgi:hypothetical protein
MKFIANVVFALLLFLAIPAVLAVNVTAQIIRAAAEANAAYEAKD